MSCLRGKVALITGATGGLGRCISHQLAASGCKLFLTGRSKDKLFDLKNSLLAKNPDTIIAHAPANLNKTTDISNIISNVRTRFRKVDILINCAGVFFVSPLEETKKKQFKECFKVNVEAPYTLCKEFLPEMKKRSWGRIINIGSSSSYNGFKNTSVYCASKHALLGLSRSLHNEGRDSGVRVFCVSPGSIKTEMGKLVENQDFETFLEPEEIAEYISFILSFDNELISEEIRMNRLEVQ